jgi:hypothetical protein
MVAHTVMNCSSQSKVRFTSLHPHKSFPSVLFNGVNTVFSKLFRDQHHPGLLGPGTTE